MLVSNDNNTRINIELSMKRNISHLLYIVAIGFFTSCSDFLDVAPKDKVLEEDSIKRKQVFMEL